jgi:hypothetical protein
MKRTLALLLVLITSNLTFSQNVPSYLPTSGLIGWWPFNGNANDISGNLNNGTVYNALLTTDRFGNNNSAYSFNSSLTSHISLNNSIGNFGTSNFTISWWQSRVFINAASASCVFGKRNAFGSGNFVQTNSNPGFEIRQGTNSSDYVADNGNAVDSSSNWFHSVVIRKDTQIFVYVNGSLTYTFSSPIIQNLNNNALAEIGARYAGSSLVQLFNGKIDDLGIWNRALTFNEIHNLYKSECADSIISQPINITSSIGYNTIFSLTRSGSSINYNWQSNSVGLGWQNVPNTNQYSGANTNSLTINNLNVSNHNQLFRVISGRTWCNADTSNIVKLTISNIASDSARLIRLSNDSARLTLDSVNILVRINKLIQDSSLLSDRIVKLSNDSIYYLGRISKLMNDSTLLAGRVIKLKNDSVFYIGRINKLLSDSIVYISRIGSLQVDSINNKNTIISLNQEITSKNNVISLLQNDTTSKGNTIRSLQLALDNKHDTVYVSSLITADTLKITITTGLSINSNVVNGILVYPNPATSILYLDLKNPGYYTATMTGVVGQAIITPTSGTIDISGLANGVYVLSIYDKDNKLVSTNKVMILR